MQAEKKAKLVDQASELVQSLAQVAIGIAERSSLDSFHWKGPVVGLEKQMEFSIIDDNGLILVHGSPEEPFDSSDEWTEGLCVAFLLVCDDFMKELTDRCASYEMYLGQAVEAGRATLEKYQAG
jgi:hypothetical protein